MGYLEAKRNAGEINRKSEFIPNMGHMTQPDSNRGQRSVAFLAAKELYDPENKMLMSIFSDQPYDFK